MSEILFLQPALLGDIVEIGFETIKFGISSITVKFEDIVKSKGHFNNRSSCFSLPR
jgi:acyl-CoA hydrolase